MHEDYSQFEGDYEGLNRELRKINNGNSNWPDIAYDFVIAYESLIKEGPPSGYPLAKSITGNRYWLYLIPPFNMEPFMIVLVDCHEKKLHAPHVIGKRKPHLINPSVNAFCTKYGLTTL